MFRTAIELVFDEEIANTPFVCGDLFTLTWVKNLATYSPSFIP